MTKRKGLFVDKRFKNEFLLRNTCLLIFSILLTIVLVKVWENNRLKQGILISPPTTQQVVQWAEQNGVSQDSPEFISQFIVQAKTYTLFDLIWQPLVVVLLLNAIFLYVTNLYFSHRVMGPIHRLKMALIKKKEGQETGPISFRDKDYFHDLAILINDILYPDTLSKESKNRQETSLNKGK